MTSEIKDTKQEDAKYRGLDKHRYGDQEARIGGCRPQARLSATTGMVRVVLASKSARNGYRDFSLDHTCPRRSPVVVEAVASNRSSPASTTTAGFWARLRYQSGCLGAAMLDAMTIRSSSSRSNHSGVVRRPPVRRPVVVSRSSCSRSNPSIGPPARNCSMILGWSPGGCPWSNCSRCGSGGDQPNKSLGEPLGVVRADRVGGVGDDVCLHVASELLDAGEEG